MEINNRQLLSSTVSSLLRVVTITEMKWKTAFLAFKRLPPRRTSLQLVFNGNIIEWRHRWRRTVVMDYACCEHVIIRNENLDSPVEPHPPSNPSHIRRRLNLASFSDFEPSIFEHPCELLASNAINNSWEGNSCALTFPDSTNPAPLLRVHPKKAP